MTTNIAVTTTAYQVEKRGWLWGPDGTGPGDNPSITLDFSTIGSARRADGYVPSGIVLGRITATGKYGEFDSGASDGRQTAVGHLFSSVATPANLATPVGGALVVKGSVDPARLPFAAAAVGGLPATGRPALIHYGS